MLGCFIWFCHSLGYIRSIKTHLPIHTHKLNVTFFEYVHWKGFVLSNNKNENNNNRIKKKKKRMKEKENKVRMNQNKYDKCRR